MRKFRLFIGEWTTAVVLGAGLCVVIGSLTLETVFAQRRMSLSGRYPILGVCDQDTFKKFLSSEDIQTIGRGPDDTIDVWSRRFRNDIESALTSLTEEDDEVECTGQQGGGNELRPLPAVLRTMAVKLPPWEKEAQSLGRQDAGAVLQEYLRAYECALEERRFFIFPEVHQEMVLQGSAQGFLNIGDFISISAITMQEAPDQSRKIARELRTARPLINRLTGLALGLDRFGDLDAAVTCLQRASLDLRNGAGLAAEAASQLPRVLDVKDPLRDFNAP